MSLQRDRIRLTWARLDMMAILPDHSGWAKSICVLKIIFCGFTVAQR